MTSLKTRIQRRRGWGGSGCDISSRTACRRPCAMQPGADPVPSSIEEPQLPTSSHRTPLLLQWRLQSALAGVLAPGHSRTASLACRCAACRAVCCEEPPTFYSTADQPRVSCGCAREEAVQTAGSCRGGRRWVDVAAADTGRGMHRCSRAVWLCVCGRGDAAKCKARAWPGH